MLTVSIGSLAMYTRKPGIMYLRYDSQSKLSISKLKICRSAGFTRFQSSTTASLLNCHCCVEKYDITELNLLIFLYTFTSLKICNSIKTCKFRDDHYTVNLVNPLHRFSAAKKKHSVGYHSRYYVQNYLTDIVHEFIFV